MAKKKFEKIIRDRALGYPETREDHPWGESAFKVKGKTFVFMGAHDGELSFSVKLPASGEFALTLSGSEPTHYGLGSKGWVTIRPADANVPDDVLYKLIDESYRANAPKTLVARLDEAGRRTIPSVRHVKKAGRRRG